RRHSTAPPKRRRPHPGVACKLRRRGRARSRAPRHHGRPRRPIPRAPVRIDPPELATSDDQRPTQAHRRTPIASDVQRYGQFVSGTFYENGAAQTACLLKGVPQDPPGENSRRRALYGAPDRLTAKITATEPEPATGRQPISFPASPRRAWPHGAAMTDHIQNNPFGRSTDDHRDDWSAAQIGGSFSASLPAVDTCCPSLVVGLT